jgi:amino acid adenylation domain-containing protein
MTSERTEEDALRRRIAALPTEMRAAFERRLGQASPPRANDRPIPSADEFLSFALTDVQQAYWAGRTGDFDLGTVSTHNYVEVQGRDLDLDRLACAWRQLIDRHPMLRAVISRDGTQRVLPEVPPYAIARDDLRSLPTEAADAILASTRERMSHQVLPLEQWPLFEIRASLIDQRRTRLHLSFDSMTIDLDSRTRLLREWGDLYKHPDAALPPLPCSFRDAITKARLDESARAHARDYWLARLESLPPAPDLPQRDVQPERIRFTRRTGRLDADAWERLARIARDGGLSANALLLAVYADVLALWQGGGPFTLNLTLFNRAPEAAGVVGNFTGLSLLEVAARGTQRFGERARQIQEQLWRDIDHRQFGGVAVIRKLLRARADPSRAVMPVVFTSALSADGVARDELDWLGEETFSISQTPQVWIDLMIRNAAGGVRYDWNSVDAVFPDGMMADMFAAFARLIEALANGVLTLADPWRRVAALLLPAEDARVTAEANDTQAPLSTRLLHELWRDRVAQAADHPALIDASGTMTYRQLARRGAGVARRIAEAGPVPLVAIVIPKGWEQVAAVIGVLEAGAAYLPIDPAWPAARIAQILEQSKATLALIRSGDPVPAWAGHVRVIAIGDDADADPPLTSLPKASPDDLAYVIYTSGSSGQPKGVAIDHRGAVNTVLDINQRFGIGPDDRVLALSALSFDLSVYDIFGTLAAGATIVMPDAEQASDPASLAQLVRMHGVTLWNSVPALMELVADHALRRPGLRFDSLRHVLLSGDRISPALPALIRRTAPAARITSLGGATEASIWSIFHPIDPDAIGSSIPYGRPLANQRFRVVDPKMADLPIWVPGELCIGGVALARGYLGEPETSAARFVVDPVGGERWYRTGDRGRYLPDGTIEFLGRTDDQVKINGFRIELGEIERVASRHPAVRAVAVVASGTGALCRKLVCHIVPEGAWPGAAVIRDHLHRVLPAYMIPSVFSPLAALPLTPNGKVDRKRLAAMVPTGAGQRPEPQHEAPAERDPIVQAVGAMVAKIAGVPVPSADASLLDLGVTSVEAIRIVHAIGDRFGTRPNVRDFYVTPTVGWLAAQATSTNASAGESGLIQDPRARDAFKKARHGRRPTVDHENVVPLAGEVAEALRDLLDARRSVRAFALRPLPLSSLAALLDTLAQRGEQRRYGSAGDSYSVQTYLYVKPGRVAGLSGGAYYYDPKASALHLLDGGARLTNAAFDPFTGASAFEEAAFVVALVAELRAIESLYGSRSLEFAGIEAGLMTGLLEIAAPVCGLAACQIGSADEAILREVFALGPSHRALHVVVAGIGDPGGGASASLMDEERRLSRLIDRVATLTEDETAALLGACRSAAEDVG